MNIVPVSLKPAVTMKAQPNVPSATAPKKDPALMYPPAAMGAINGACWFGIGFVFDKACKAMFKTNTSNKTSLIVNGLIGLAMGTYTYVKAKKLQKEALNKLG